MPEPTPSVERLAQALRAVWDTDHPEMLTSLAAAILAALRDEP